MSEKSSAEPTEEPTSRKLQKARDDGQVARSIELPAAAVTIGAILVLYMIGSVWMAKIANVFANQWVG